MGRRGFATALIVICISLLLSAGIIAYGMYETQTVTTIYEEKIAVESEVLAKNKEHKVVNRCGSVGSHIFFNEENSTNVSEKSSIECIVRSLAACTPAQFEYGENKLEIVSRDGFFCSIKNKIVSREQNLGSPGQLLCKLSDRVLMVMKQNTEAETRDVQKRSLLSFIYALRYGEIVDPVTGATLTFNCTHQ